MKKYILGIILILSMTFNSYIFAASGNTAANTLTDITNEKITFEITSVEVIDDKNIDFTFSSPLAEEPVEIKIIKISDNSELGIEEAKVDTTKTKVSVKLIDGLFNGETYGYYIPSAMDEKGKKINQTDKDILDIEIPESLTLPEANDAEKTEQTNKAMQDTFAETKENPEKVGQTTTENLDAAPEANTIPESVSNTESQSQPQPQAKDISINNAKQLPKTGPAEGIIAIAALMIGALIYHFRRKSIKE